MSDWRNEPISRRQIIMLKSVDDYFTFDRLENMSKGEASDLINEYYKDGKLIDGTLNMRAKKATEKLGAMAIMEQNNIVKNNKTIVNGIVREIVNEAAKIVLERYGV